MAANELRCRNCDRTFAAKPGSDLHCSSTCDTSYAAARDEAFAQLTGAGFTVDAAVPNMYWRDQIAVTIEQVIHEGFEETLAAHQRAVAARA